MCESIRVVLFCVCNSGVQFSVVTKTFLKYRWKYAIGDEPCGGNDSSRRKGPLGAWLLISLEQIYSWKTVENPL